jgi:farnesol dehydrogenase
MRVLLTGGTGYLGGRLAARLRDAGHNVRLMVRDVPAARAKLGNDYEMKSGDLARPSGFAEIVSGCEAVIHSGALVRNWSRRPEEFERTNVAGSWSLCEAALDERVVAFVYTSSFFALGPSPNGLPVDESALEAPSPRRFYNDYHSTKYRSARLLREFISRGLPLVTLFPTVLYGPGADTDGNHVGKILRMLQNRKFPGYVGSGEQRWNLAYIDDVVAGHIRAMERAEAGDTFILGGHDVALREMAVRAAKRLNVPPPTRRLPFRLCHWIAAAEEAKARVMGGTPRLTHGEVEIYRHDWIYSSRKAEEGLGYTVTPFEEGLERTIEWVESHPA